MGEKQEIGLLLQEVATKEVSMENSNSPSMLSDVANYADILSNQSHKQILNWMRDKNLGKHLYFSLIRGS